MEALADKVKWSQDSEGIWLSLRVTDAKRICEKVKVGKTYDIKITEHRQKRSRDANSYLWVLCDKLADAVDSTKEDVYRDAIRDRGLFKDFHNLGETESKTFMTAWGMLGVGWFAEKLDYERDRDHVCVRAYYGSSTYNTKQFSRILDGIVQDCKAVGIETLTPQELEAMMSGWGR